MLDELIDYSKKHFKNLLLHEDSTGAVKMALFPSDEEFAVYTNEYLDIKCGSIAKFLSTQPGFSLCPVATQMWVRVNLPAASNFSQVKKTLQVAYELAYGHLRAERLMVMHDHHDQQAYTEQAIPFKNKADQHQQEPAEVLPEPIQALIQSYDYSMLPFKARRVNFLKQARMMEDFEDDYQDVVHTSYFFPTYHDLNGVQLRTYFTFRSHLRQGKYLKTDLGYCLLYLTELINLIGCKQAEDAFDAMQKFKEHYLSKYPEERLSLYLDNWQKDLTIFYQLDNDIFKDVQARDQQLSCLVDASNESKQAIAQALSSLSTYQPTGNSLYKKQAEQYEQLVGAVWQNLISRDPKALQFFLGKSVVMPKTIFAQTIFAGQAPVSPEFVIDPIRRVFYEKGSFYEASFWPIKNSKTRLNALLQEIDRQLRLMFKLGRPLKQRSLPPAYVELVTQSLIDWQRRGQKLKRPKVEIDVSALDQIRLEADQTTEQLLTEQERDFSADVMPVSPGNDQTDQLLSDSELEFLRMLINGQDGLAYLKKQHLMPSIVCEQINEKLFDEIGDNVLEMLDELPTIVDDYLAEVKDICNIKD